MGFPLPVAIKDGQNSLAMMEASKQIFQQAHKGDTNPRWHVSLSPVRQLFGRGDICRSGVMRLVNRGFGYSWTFSPHLCPECIGLAFQTLSPVTGETPAALESTAPCCHPSLVPSNPPPHLHLQDITPVLGSRAWEEEMKIFPVGGCSRWPADVHIVFLDPNWFEGC